jgi:mannose/fructose-specific phosphotransferase system component IIA
MSSAPKLALVAGHADFAAGLVSAVEAIAGHGDRLVPIQVRGLCGEDIEALLRDRLQETGSLVIFTDLQAGSCTMAARRVLREVPGALLVAGVNLPMLLEFVLSAESDPVVAARAAAERGRGAVSVHGGAA